MLKKLFTEILDFVIPPLCVACNDPLEKDQSFICASCSAKLVRCTAGHPWQKSYIAKGFMNNSLSLYLFVKDTPIQYLIHSLKYEKMKSIGIMLGKEIGRNLPTGVKFDFAVPVPLHLAKYRERTYNQSEYICSGICSNNGSKAVPDMLTRKRFTKSQTHLNKTERQENVKDAFGINKKYADLIRGKNVILADDVITTGATILECARVLKDNGSDYVMICSAAYDAIDVN